MNSIANKNDENPQYLAVWAPDMEKDKSFSSENHQQMSVVSRKTFLWKHFVGKSRVRETEISKAMTNYYNVTTFTQKNSFKWKSKFQQLDTE